MTFCVGADLDENEEDITLAEDQYSEIRENGRSTAESFKEAGKFKKALFWMCGIENRLKQSHDENFDKVDNSIDEEVTHANWCNLNAVISIAVAGFFYAFFNKYD
jgi:hypothetical protein